MPFRISFFIIQLIIVAVNLQSVFGVECRYYPFYPTTTNTYFTTTCKKCCSTRYPNTAQAACCDSGSGTGTTLGTIAGSVVGGVLLCCCGIVAIIVCCVCKSKNKSRINNRNMVNRMPQTVASITQQQTFQPNISTYPTNATAIAAYPYQNTTTLTQVPYPNPTAPYSYQLTPNNLYPNINNAPNYESFKYQQTTNTVPDSTNSGLQLPVLPAPVQYK